MKSNFNITGMTCSSCVSHVEKAVNKIDGIKKVNVNLLSNSMIVEFDENQTNNEAIAKAVIDAGYGVNIIKNKKHSETKKEPIITNEEIKLMKKREQQEDLTIEEQEEQIKKMKFLKLQN